MKKEDVQFHSDGYGRRSSPAVNVKVYSIGAKAADVAAKFACSEEDAEKALDLAFTSHQGQFWDDVQDDAEHVFGSGVKVYSEGRSAGWLVVHGLPDFESWDAIMLGKWARFEKSIRESIAYLTSAQELEETIGANDYYKHGAEEYNFVDRADGSTACIADLKRDAIAAGFGPVVKQ